MTGFQLPLATAIALSAARREDAETERRLHRAAHNEVVGTPGDPAEVDCFVSLLSCDVGERHIRFYLKMAKGTSPRILTHIEASGWKILPDGLLLNHFPIAGQSMLTSMAGRTLQEAGVTNETPWSKMRFTSTSEEEDGFHLKVPELEQMVGCLGHDGTRTWTGEWM